MHNSIPIVDSQATGTNEFRGWHCLATLMLEVTVALDLLLALVLLLSGLVLGLQIERENDGNAYVLLLISFLVTSILLVEFSPAPSSPSM